VPRTSVKINLEALQHFVLLSGHNAATLAIACEPELDRSTVSNILAGARNPSADSLKRITVALRVPMTAVLAAPLEKVGS
jgi:transcriptional regulator with XRE-family HTH domain